MTILLELNDSVVAGVQQQAAAVGKDLKSYLEDTILTWAQTRPLRPDGRYLPPPTEEQTQARLAVLQSFNTEEWIEEGEPDWDLETALKEHPISFRQVHLDD